MKTRSAWRILMVVGSSLVPGLLQGQAFSTAPLRELAAWENNPLPRDIPGMLRWFREHPGQLDQDQAFEAREQIYAILAADLRQRFTRNGDAGLPAADSATAQLLAEADRLGVYSAFPVASRLGYSRTGPRSQVPGVEFDLQLNGALFSLSAIQGRWTVQFPWYFMLWGVHRVEQGDVLPADVVSLSTLTAAHAGLQNGASQATILIVSSETDDAAAFLARWLATAGVTPRDTVPKVVPNALRSYARVDRPRELRTEMSVFKIPSGSMLIGYFGREGTFQANRQHYLDLLASLRVR